MSVDDETMHQHFFYVMDNFEKLANKVEELELNIAVILYALTEIGILYPEEDVEDE